MSHLEIFKDEHPSSRAHAESHSCQIDVKTERFGPFGLRVREDDDLEKGKSATTHGNEGAAYSKK